MMPKRSRLEFDDVVDSSMLPMSHQFLTGYQLLVPTHKEKTADKLTKQLKCLHQLHDL